MNKKGKKVLKIILISISAFVITLVAFVCGFLIYASATTLKVKNVEAMQVDGAITAKVDKSSDIDLLTWNIGYGSLDEKVDFYMDGGKMVQGQSKEATIENINAMTSKIKELDPDIFLIQEADINSKRSYKVNEVSVFKEAFDGAHYEQSLARNFKAGYIPVPLGNALGKVESGITTFAKFDVSAAERVQLPIPFSWPVKLLNLKRCLLVNRLAIEGSEKELIIINLHLEAYDDGEGKAKQLKQLMDIMQEEVNKGNYVIAGGDFNQTFSTTNYQKYPKTSDWACPVIDASEYPNFQFVMDDNVPTCRSLNKPYFDSDKATHQYWMIDGFVVSKNVQINTLETLDLQFKNTDHNPVKMNINLL